LRFDVTLLLKSYVCSFARVLGLKQTLNHTLRVVRTTLHEQPTANNVTPFTINEAASIFDVANR